MKKNIIDDLHLALTPVDLVERATIMVQQENIRYSQAIVEICKELEIEPEDVAQLIPNPLKEKMRHEAMAFNNLPDTRTNTLKDLE